MGRLVLVLLPEPLERFGRRALVEELLATGAAVAADPPRVSYRRQVALPQRVALRQARRLRKQLRDEPEVVVIFAVEQRPLAVALALLMPELVVVEL